jgi:low affinity Fe/Cu permease
MHETFRRAAHVTADAVGSPWAFRCDYPRPRMGGAWASLRLFGYVQLVINTGTTIVTFMVVFLIQNTQNRDAKAVLNRAGFPGGSRP